MGPLEGGCAAMRPQWYRPGCGRPGRARQLGWFRCVGGCGCVVAVRPHTAEPHINTAPRP